MTLESLQFGFRSLVEQHHRSASELNALSVPALSKTAQQSQLELGELRRGIEAMLAMDTQPFLAKLEKAQNADDAYKVSVRYGQTGLILLIETLKHPDDFLRYQAARALFGWKRDADLALPALLNLIVEEGNSDNAFMAGSVIEHVTRALCAHEIAQLAKALWAKPARTLLALAAPASIPAVCEAFRTAHSGVKRVILEIFSSAGSKAEAAVPDLIIELSNPDHYMRADVIKALQDIGPKAEAAVPALIAILLQDSSLRARERAAYALQIIGVATTEVITVLNQGLADSEDEVSLACFVTLEKLPPACESLPFLQELLQRRPKWTNDSGLKQRILSRMKELRRMPDRRPKR